MAYFDLEEYGDHCVVRFFLGNIGPEFLEELEQQLASVLAAASGDIILDMGEVESVCPDVLHFFTRYRMMCREQGRQLALAEPCAELVREIRALSPPFTVPVYGKLDEAFQGLPPGELPESGPERGQLFCERTDCVFNQALSAADARRICTHEYAQMIGNPRSCRYFRMNWVEVAEETDRLLEGHADLTSRGAERTPRPAPRAPRAPAPPPPEPPVEIASAQGPLDEVPPPSPAPDALAPKAAATESPAQVVKRYIEASNRMDFETESLCLASSMLGGPRDEYVRMRREVFANLAKTGPIPQYFFLRLNRENRIGEDRATVDCIRGEIDSMGRRELRQIFQLTLSGGEWKITSISSGGRPPRALSRPTGKV